MCPQEPDAVALTDMRKRGECGVGEETRRDETLNTHHRFKLLELVVFLGFERFDISRSLCSRVFQFLHPICTYQHSIEVIVYPSRSHAWHSDRNGVGRLARERGGGGEYSHCRAFWTTFAASFSASSNVWMP